MDFIAADLDGNGQVGASDALDILRAAVGLSATNAPRWVFLDPDADLSEVSRTATMVETGFHSDSLAGEITDLNLIGILVGNVQEYP